MGSSSSKTTTTNETDQTFINQTTVDVINKNTNEAVANALINSKAECSTVNDISQSISFHGCKVAGDLVITGVKQDAVITVDFSCLNAFSAEQEMAQSLLSELTTDLQSKLDATTLNDMNTKAETQATTSGVDPFGSSSSSTTNTSNIYNLEVINEQNTSIQNVIATSVQSNFEVESIQSCLTQNSISQQQDYSNCEVGGSLTVSELEQKAGITAVVNCVNNSGVVQDVMNSAANAIGVVAINDTEADATNKMTNDIKTIAETVGLGACPQCCGENTGIALLCLISLCVVCVFVLLVMFGPDLIQAGKEAAAKAK